MRQSRKKQGFTLVEMMAVVLIIGILVTIIVGVAGSVIQKANVKKTLMTMRVISNAITACYDETKTYPNGAGVQIGPSTLSGSAAATKILGSLPTDALSGGVYVDGFGNPICYYRSGGAGNFPYLVSPGPDGALNTADDIRSDNN